MKPYTYQFLKDKTVVLKLPALTSSGYIWSLDLTEQSNNISLLKEEYVMENNMHGHNCFHLLFLEIKQNGI